MPLLDDSPLSQSLLELLLFTLLPLGMSSPALYLWNRILPTLSLLQHVFLPHLLYVPDLSMPDPSVPDLPVLYLFPLGLLLQARSLFRGVPLGLPALGLAIADRFPLNLDPSLLSILLLNDVLLGLALLLPKSTLSSLVPRGQALAAVPTRPAGVVRCLPRP